MSIKKTVGAGPRSCPKQPMNKIEKLIDELCPQGVEFKEVNKVCQISRGRVMSKDYLSTNAGEYPVYSSQTVNQGIFGRINTYDYDGEYVTWTTDGANAGSIFHRNGKFSITNVCGLLKPKKDDLNTKYLSYILGTLAKSYVSAGMGNPKIMSNVMAKIQIPTPPLSIQKEIVKILDNFTQLEAELEAELKAELEARKKQYEHYREELLSFGDDVEFRALGEIADFSQGIQVDVSEQSQEQQTSFIRFLRIVDFVKDDEPPRYIKSPGSRYVKTDGDLVMIRYGASAAGKVFLKYSGAIANNMFQIKLKTNELITKFLYCYLYQTKIYNFLNSSGGSSTMPAITFGQIGSVKIPIPPLSKQQEIVAILDKFDALVNDISTGLPAEIAARKKQYEYYRNQLLTFKCRGEPCVRPIQTTEQTLEQNGRIQRNKQRANTTGEYNGRIQGRTQRANTTGEYNGRIQRANTTGEHKVRPYGTRNDATACTDK